MVSYNMYDYIIEVNATPNINTSLNGKRFISVKKNEMLNQLIDMYIDEINISFEKIEKN
jgi:hypothetical protein